MLFYRVITSGSTYVSRGSVLVQDYPSTTIAALFLVRGRSFWKIAQCLDVFMPLFYLTHGVLSINDLHCSRQ